MPPKPPPSPIPDNAPHIPASLLVTLPDWYSKQDTEFKSQRGEGPDKELYVAIGALDTEGWVCMDAIPSDLRRTKVAAAGRVDKARARNAPVQTPSQPGPSTAPTGTTATPTQPQTPAPPARTPRTPLPAPVPGRVPTEWDSAPSIPTSLLATDPEWYIGAKAKTARNDPPNKEIYVELDSLHVAGWVRMDAIPGNKRGPVGASAARQDAARLAAWTTQQQQGPSPPLPSMPQTPQGTVAGPSGTQDGGASGGGTEGRETRSAKRKREAGDDGGDVGRTGQAPDQRRTVIGCKEVLRPGASHGPPLMRCKAFECRKRVCGACYDGVFDHAFTDAERAEITGAMARGRPIAAVEICTVCERNELRQKNLEEWPENYEDCKCLHFRGIWGCEMHRTNEVSSSVGERNAELARRKFIFGREGGCGCSRSLDGSGVWRCEFCAGVIVMHS
ncbi:hypothetical protein K461DRAFT_111856 [Myriangium duriaei CBS 260.36]|uniref:Uncharacterized protein n=1 Tax=Myriangium duriaei CBS 260.36 TaxID=1168546 RepID=A0A9P4JAL3_9PEZI|nr:hypothetical protein K461DRAFT_111856 [Myriangium duriaei CBS 260.36]